MTPKQMLLAHGEKAAVALVVVVSGWLVISAFTDSSIRPSGVTQQSVRDEIDGIEKVMNSSNAPQLAGAPPYKQQMQERFNQNITSSARISWLMAHSDISGQSAGLTFYVYEIYQPTVVATDTIGKLEITVTAPQPHAGSERRSSDPDKPWTRQSEKGTINNHAGVAGIQIQVKVGDGDWQPLKSKEIGDKGFISLAQLRAIGGKIHIPAMAEWQIHSFRVRTVAHATGFTGESPDADETVLVHAGEYEEPKDWLILSGQEADDANSFLSQWVTGTKDAIPGVDLPKNELVYYSDWSDVADVMSTAKVRFAFEHASEDLANPGVPTIAHFYFSKQFPVANGYAWLAKVVTFQSKINDPVGGMKDVVTPTSGVDTVNESFETPFKLQGFELNQERILYYTIDLKTNETSHAKELQINSKTISTTVAELLNTNTNTVRKLPQLIKIKHPNGHAPYFPLVPLDGYDEVKEFTTNPPGYIQRDLIPVSPVFHDPTTPGPLADLHNRTDAAALAIAQFATTTIPYVIIPGGRLVWYDEHNRKVREYPPGEAPVIDKPKSNPSTPVETPTHRPIVPPRTNGSNGNRPPGIGPDGPPGNQPPGQQGGPNAFPGGAPVSGRPGDSGGGSGGGQGGVYGH
jgi:hypothetical protein